ncbi:MAG TPA: universal stress protein [Pyrinomonadaceae bacterium]
MFPFRNVLFPTDFSTHSRCALKYAAAFARNGNGRVVILNAQDTAVPAKLLALTDDELRNHDNQSLLQLKASAKQLLNDTLLEGLDVEALVLEGEPAATIAETAVDYGIDLITVVTRGRKRFSRAFRGSIAEDIIAEAPCPVLATKSLERDFVESSGPQTQLNLKRIVLATNFRPSSVAATQMATQISNRMCAELHAVYVIGDYFEQISAMFPEGGLAALTRLRSYIGERMSHLADGAGRRAASHIAEGRPYEEVVKLATRIEADLIVIGSAAHNSLFGGSAVLGSEVERVIRNSPCPVLCVPAAKVVTPLPALVTQPVT